MWALDVIISSGADVGADVCVISVGIVVGVVPDENINSIKILKLNY